MSTDDSELRRLLAQLHERLHGASTVDDESRRLLSSAARDIERALERREQHPTDTRSRLRELAAQFEADHPALAEAVREVVDTLGKAGV
jgi:uncharacterized protein DUF4404